MAENQAVCIRFVRVVRSARKSKIDKFFMEFRRFSLGMAVHRGRRLLTGFPREASRVSSRNFIGMALDILSLFSIFRFSVSFKTMESLRLNIMRLIAECCGCSLFEYLRFGLLSSMASMS